MVPTIHYFFWVRYHPNKIYSQKKSWLETKYRPLFPPTTKPQPLNPIDREPTSLVLARYRLVVLWSFCACFIIFCFCLPRRFCRSRLVLFRSDVCFCLISSRVSYCVCLFLWFGFSFLHMIPVADTSCYSLFLFIVLFHINFHAYPFIQKNLGLCGPDNADWIKRVLGPICLNMLKPFCWRTVFCDRFVFCGRSVFCCKFVIFCRFACCCRLFSLTLLSLDLSYSSVFLVGLWALLFIGLSFVWAFVSCNLLGFLPHGPLGTDLQKWASTIWNHEFLLDPIAVLPVPFGF